MPTKPDARLLALIVASAQFMAALDGAVIAIALPHMAHDFHTSPLSLSIGITAYMLVQAALLPSCSWIADRFGARTVFVLAIAGFVISSMLCGFSRSLPEFVAARVLQGASGAMMNPVGRIVVFQATEKKDLVTIITISTVPMLFAPTLGPPLGGLIVTYWTWPWIFFLNVPIGIAGILLSLKFIPNLMPAQRRPFDFQGFGLTAVAIVGVLYGLHEMGFGAAHWAIASTLILIGVGAVLGATTHLRRHPSPILSLDALRFATFRIARTSGQLAIVPFWALNFMLPLMLQVTLGLNPLVTGIMLLAMSGGDIIMKPFTSQTLRWFGFRNVILVGTVAYAASVAASAFFSHGTPTWLIFAVLWVNGMIRSVLFSAISALSFVDVPQEEMSSASVLNGIINQVSGAIGVSVAAIVLNLKAFTSQGPQTLSLADCQLGIGIIALVCLSSMIGFLRMSPTAGAAVSGHLSPVEAAAD